MDIPVQQSDNKLLGGIKTLYFGVGISLIVLAILPFVVESALPAISNDSIWVGEVKQGDFSHEIRGVGTLVATDNRWISAASPGVVERVLVKPGARVESDSVLIKLTNPELERDFKQAEWELNAAEAKLVALKAEIEEQKLEHKMLVAQAKMEVESALMTEKAQKPLAEKHIISSLDFENTKLRSRQSELMLQIHYEKEKRRNEVTKAQLLAEEAQVWKYRHQLERLNEQVSDLNVRAGIAGVLQQVSIEVGQQVQVGSSVARVARPENLIAELQVQEVNAQEISLQLPVVIDTRNGLIDGKVVRIDPRVNRGTVQVDVAFTSDLPKGVRPDLSVTGIISVETITNTLFIDRPASVSANSETTLYKVDLKTNVAKQIRVQFGSASVSQIEIISGLRMGEKVLLSDTTEFRKYEMVQIN